MNSQRAKRSLAGSLDRNADRRRGYGPTARRMSGFRTLALAVQDVTKLPVSYTADALQNTSGEFIYLAGYSTLDGGDVLG